MGDITKENKPGEATKTTTEHGPAETQGNVDDQAVRDNMGVPDAGDTNKAKPGPSNEPKK